MELFFSLSLSLDSLSSHNQLSINLTGWWSNVTSELTKTAQDGPASGFKSGQTNAFCYGVYYECAAKVKNTTIGDDVYPPSLFVFDENGNQKAKPPAWDAYAVAMCGCKKPLLICFDALNCYPDNPQSKENLCGRIKNECNRGECPSRGVFCDEDNKCGWNQEQIDGFTDAKKKAILAQRAVSAASSLTASLVAVVATAVFLF